MSDSKHPTSEDLASILEASHPNRRWLKWVVSSGVLVGLAVVAFFLFGRPRANGQNEPMFKTESLKKGAVELTITATGNLVPTNEVTVGSEISGLVLEVYVDSNDRVEKGQKLALIDTTKLENELRSSRASLESAKANVKQSEATVKQAKATLERYQKLREKSDGKIPSEASMESAIANLEIAEATLVARKASVTQGEAQIEIKETELSKAHITSPTNGIVLTRSVEPGQTVAASFSAPELFLIAEDLSTMKLEVAIAEADIGQLADGQNATFTVDAWPSRKFDATVMKVSYGSEVVDNVVSYETELDVKNNDLLLRPGMTATADIFVANHADVWVVPVQALRFQPTGGLAMVSSVGGKMGPPPGNGSLSSGKSEAASEKSSFLDKMIPHPPRRPRGNRGMPTSKTVKSGELAKIWVMEDGHPRPIPVKVGLSDGSVSEVSSELLNAGMEVILYETPTQS